MYMNRRVLCLVPARSGSRALPGKNTAIVAGKTLIQRAVEAGTGSSHIDDVVVTTDDYDIADAAKLAGARVPFIRPAELARDSTRMVEVVEHALGELSDLYGYLVLLQPTSPLRTARHVDEAFARLMASGGKAVVSVCLAEHNPLLAGTLPADGNLSRFVDARAQTANRQDLETYYRLNGAVYVSEVGYWRCNRGFLGPETYAYIMEPRDSIDIDTDLDLEVARCLMARESSRNET